MKSDVCRDLAEFAHIDASSKHEARVAAGREAREVERGSLHRADDSVGHKHAPAQNWPIVGAQLEQVLRGEGAVWHENQCVPIIRHGALQEVYWTCSYTPIDEPASPYGVGGVLVTCSETTQQVLTERKLAFEREQFVRLFDQAPTFLALLRGPDHVIELANADYLALTGNRPVVGRRLADALPETVTQGYVALLEEVHRTGKP